MKYEITEPAQSGGKEMSRTCGICDHYEPFSGVCCNGGSEYCAEYMDEDEDSCPNWERREE